MDIKSIIVQGLYRDIIDICIHIQHGETEFCPGLSRINVRGIYDRNNKGEKNTYLSGFQITYECFDHNTTINLI